MIELNGGDWFDVDRVSFPGIEEFDPTQLNLKNVRLDGKLYLVLGVETFAIHNKTGKPFSLLVREVNYYA